MFDVNRSTVDEDLRENGIFTYVFVPSDLGLWPLTPPVSIVQQYVSTKLEVSAAFMLRQNRRHGTNGRRVQRLMLPPIGGEPYNKMVNGYRYYRALESVSIASALSSALLNTICPYQIRVHQRWQSKLSFLQLGRRSGGKPQRTVYTRRLPVSMSTLWYTLL